MSLENLYRQRHLLYEKEITVLFPRKGGPHGYSFWIENGVPKYYPPDAKDFKYLLRWWLRTIYSAKHCGRKTYQQIEEEVGELLGTTKKSSRIQISIKPINQRDIVRIKEEYESLFVALKHKLADAQGRIESTIENKNRYLLQVKGNEMGKSIIFKQKRRGGKKVKIDINDIGEIQTTALTYVLDVPRIKLAASSDVTSYVLLYRSNINKLVETLSAISTNFLYVPKRLPLKLEIYGDPNLKKKIEALAELALTMGSVGSIANRGFGSITYAEIPTSVDEVINIVDNVIRVFDASDGATRNPVIPTLTIPDHIFKVRISNVRVRSVLRRISEAYLRQRNSRLSNLRLPKRRVLGMPRIRNSGMRMRSMIATKILKMGRKQAVVLTYGFKWMGNRSVDHCSFNEVFDAVVSYFEED